MIISEADRRLNVESVILAVISNYGGERLAADNPAMPRMVSQLADEFDALCLDGRFVCTAEGIEPEPSVHDPITKSYAIDQIADIEHLRAVAHRMWDAFSACHEQSAHLIGALVGESGCEQCARALLEDARPCDRYDEWQKKVTDGFGSV